MTDDVGPWYNPETAKAVDTVSHCYHIQVSTLTRQETSFEISAFPYQTSIQVDSLRGCTSGLRNNMGIDDYTLGRDYRASARLHVQHHLWSETFGYMMNPVIPTTKQGLAIADIGTGTGIWLLEVDRRLSNPSSRLCGLDISGDQFPRPEWLPPNATLSTLPGRRKT